MKRAVSLVYNTYSLSRCSNCHRRLSYSTQAQQVIEHDDHEEFQKPLPPIDVAGRIELSAKNTPNPTRKTRKYVLYDSPSLATSAKGPKQLWVKRRTNNELLALYDACLGTQNWDRSRALLKQLRAQSDDETTLKALNRYLEALVAAVPSTGFSPAQELLDEYRTTFNVAPDRVAHALMCRGALVLKDESQCEKTIKDLAHSWRLDNADFGEVLASAGILSESDAQRVFDLSGLDSRLIGTHYRSKLKTSVHPLADVTEINPTQQRGVGLKVLKHSLNAMTNPEVHFEVDREDYRRGGDALAFNLARQKAIEENAIDAAVLRWKHEHDDLKRRGGLSYKKSLNSMFWEWKEDMLPLIKEELARIDHRAQDKQNPRSAGGRYYKYRREEAEAAETLESEKEADYAVLTKSLETPDANRARRDYGPFLGLLKPEKLAAVTILEVIRSLTTETLDGLKTTSLTVKIGKAIEDEYHSEILKKKSTAELFNVNYQEALQSGRIFNMSVRKAQAKALKLQDTGLFQPTWTQSVRARVGAVLVSFLIHAARLTLSKTDLDGTVHTQEVPAFFHTYQYTKGQKLGVIKVNEEMISRLSSEPLRGSIYPRLLPMLTPPRPWLSYNSGGYLFSRTLAMRSKNCPEQLKYVKSASDRGFLDDVLAGLDVLGQTPWKINEKVFECTVIAWNSGEAIADIPPADGHLLSNMPDAPPNNADPSVRFEYLTKLKEFSATARNFASMRSDLNYKLEIARAFLYDTMYFPHSLDFRGRAYPIPPHFNHLGNDLCRGLLKFAEEKELGSNGLRWLKIHLANQCGHDKASFEEREAFADANLENVFEAADNPMNGTRWWLSVDKPWQCLAACFELTAALRAPDPHKYMSALPVHQDGTCNGLQHYAALGGDLQGAQAVNLEPSDRPQDVYRGVAEIVQEAVKKDAQAGDALALALDGHITRKVVKQTVMTNVYGVTYVGARQQVENQLLDMPIFKDKDVWAMSSYVVTKIFQALQSMFTGAHLIQEWLKQSATIITRSVHVDALLNDSQDTMTSVIWTSPLDLPIVQPYRKERRRQVHTNLQTVFISDPSDAAEVNSRKQATAFPPNFIHSLDATHMLMSALVCRQQSITFAAVHDSYWTHAADTDAMNVVLRDAFIKLHTDNLMRALVDEFKKRYTGHFTPHHHILKLSPAYAFAVTPDNIERGLVKVLERTRGIVILDPELAKATLKFSHKDAKRESGKTVAQIAQDVSDADEPEKVTHGKAFTVWTPIEFPELPSKGDFDVTNLRESKYFFS